MNIFVFLGPSLAQSKAQTILDAVYLPPVAMGDLYRLIETQAKPGDVVAIIDGLFEQVPAIWHKEVLYALSKGIHVYGASSMGALRASELHSFGMQGVGKIFEAYRDGVIQDDDEVAVSHAMAEQKYRSLSDAMASLRLGLGELFEQDFIDQVQHDHLIHSAKTQHYSRRSWSFILEQAALLALSEASLNKIKHYALTFDAKAKDATSLLKLLASKLNDGFKLSPYQADFVLQNTVFWVGLKHEERQRITLMSQQESLNSDFLLSDIARNAKALHPSGDEMINKALLLKLADHLVVDAKFTQEDLQAATKAILYRNKLHSAQAIQQWISQQRLSKSGWHDLVLMEAKLTALRTINIQELDSFIITQLRRNGEFSHLAANVIKQNEKIKYMGIKKPSLSDAGIDEQSLQKWYEGKCGQMLPDPKSHAHNLGFETLRDFINEILITYMSETEVELSS